MRRELYNRVTFIMMFMVFATFVVGAQSFNDEITAIADVVVDMEGSGDYTTVQEAISSIPDSNDTWKIIYVKNGIYYEKVILNYKKTKVILVGEDVDSTIITYDDYGNKMLVGGDPNVGGHTFSTYSFRADAHDFQAYNISFENPTTQGQGVAFHANGDRQILYHCRILGNQDTYFDTFRTRKYFKDCFIDGTTDFIFGFGVTLFDSCQIHSKSSSYITAASTPEFYEFGQVFRSCRLTAAPGFTGLKLGRPWFDWSNTIFFECWEPESVTPAGWAGWSGREATCIYREYNCFGPGSDISGRIEFGKQLDPSKAPRYVIDTILAASNFPSDMGFDVDTNEFLHVRRRFEASGYPARADTIIYAGREEIYANTDSFPPYPTENWSPEFYSDVFDLVNKYTEPFMDSINGMISVENIYWNDNAIPDFDSENLRYVVELDDTVTIVPKLTVEGEGLSISENYPEELPGEATISVLSRDGVSGSDYKVYFSQDSAYWDTELLQIIINSVDTIDIIPGVYDYDLILSWGDTKVKSILPKLKVPGQVSKKIYPTGYPGVASVNVTAPDKETIRTYTINVAINLGIADLETNSTLVQIVNPATNSIQIYNRGDQIENAEITIFDLNGRTLLSETRNNLAQGMNDTGISISELKNGIYVYRIISRNKSYSGKFIKAN